MISISRRSAGRPETSSVANLAQHVALMELLRREIDRDADGIGPFHAFHAGLAQDPAAEVDDQAHVLGDRNDIDRGHRAAHRMIPAQQRFAGRDPPRFEIDQRLVEQLEFLVGQRLAQVEFQDAARSSTVCAISSRKKQKVPRPSALAR